MSWTPKKDRRTGSRIGTSSVLVATGGSGSGGSSSEQRHSGSAVNLSSAAGSSAGEVQFNFSGPRSASAVRQYLKSERERKKLSSDAPVGLSSSASDLSGAITTSASAGSLSSSSSSSSSGSGNGGAASSIPRSTSGNNIQGQAAPSPSATPAMLISTPPSHTESLHLRPETRKSGSAGSFGVDPRPSSLSTGSSGASLLQSLSSSGSTTSLDEEDDDSDIITWQEVPIAKGFRPMPRHHSAACASPVGDVYIFSGSDEEYKNIYSDIAVLRFSGPSAEDLKWEKIAPLGKAPPPLMGHSIVADDSTFFLFGGQTNDNIAINDTYAFKSDTNTWTRLKPSGDIPSPRFGHTANKFFMGDAPSILVAFGMQLEAGKLTPTNDVYMLELGSLRWTKNQLPGAPSPRFHHSATMIGHRLYLFGGTTNGHDCCNDFYVLDTVRYSWYKMTSPGCPPARRCHAALSIGKNLIVHGGVDADGNNLDDAYIYNVDSKVWRKLHFYGKGPTGRQGHIGLAVGSNCVILGGKPFSAMIDVHVSQLGKCELRPFKQVRSIMAESPVISKVKSSTAGEDPTVAAQKAQLAAMLRIQEESQDYKQKYYELYAAFLELREIADRPTVPEGTEATSAEEDAEPPFTVSRQLESLKSTIAAANDKITKREEESKRRLLEIKTPSENTLAPPSPAAKLRPSKKRSSSAISSPKLSRFNTSMDLSIERSEAAPVIDLQEEKRREEERRAMQERLANETPEEKQERMRLQVLSEIISTEQDYVRDMNIIVNVFLKGDHNLEAHDVTALFGPIETVAPVNAQLLAGLQELFELPPAEQAVGKLFLRSADFLKVYAVYCANQGRSLDTLQLLRKHNPAFAVFLQMCQANPECRKLDLESFLIKPMQRICRYPLLLKELHRFTPESHPDFQDLGKALDKIQAVVATVNERKRECENQQQVMSIQLAMVWEAEPYFLASPARKLLKQESVSYVSTGGKKSRTELILFSDLLLIAKKKGDKMHEIATIPVRDCILWDLKEPKNAFSVRRSDKSKHVYSIVAPSPDSKLEWVHVLTDMITGSLVGGASSRKSSGGGV